MVSNQMKYRLCFAQLNIYSSMLGSYFYKIVIFYDKTHFTCNLVDLNKFMNIIKYFEEVFQVVVLKTRRLHKETSSKS